MASRLRCLPPIGELTLTLTLALTLTLTLTLALTLTLTLTITITLTAAVFTTHSESAGPLVDILSTAVGRININAQCARSPDTFPFSGRRSSAMGTMSVTEGLNTFSIETVVATRDGKENGDLVRGMEKSARFLYPL